MCMHRGLPATCSSTWKKKEGDLRHPGSKPKQLKPGIARETCAQQVSFWRKSFRLDELGHGLWVYFVLLSCTTESPLLPYRPIRVIRAGQDRRSCLVTLKLVGLKKKGMVSTAR